MGLGDGEEEGLDLAGVEAAEVGAEGAAGDVVGVNEGFASATGTYPMLGAGPTSSAASRPPARVPGFLAPAPKPSDRLQQPTTNGQVR